jgi:hypothetical protein
MRSLLERTKTMNFYNRKRQVSNSGLKLSRPKSSNYSKKSNHSSSSWHQLHNNQVTWTMILLSIKTTSVNSTKIPWGSLKTLKATEKTNHSYLVHHFIKAEINRPSLICSSPRTSLLTHLQKSQLAPVTLIKLM